MDKEQAIEYATNTIRNIDYQDKYGRPEDFDSMMDLRDCLMFLVSYIQVGQVEKK